MIKYVGIDDCIYKLKIDLDSGEVYQYDMINSIWSLICYNNITMSHSTINHTNIMTIKPSRNCRITYTIEVSQHNDFITIRKYDVCNKDVTILSRSLYTYNSDNIDKLFILNREKIPVLNFETFYSIHNNDIDKFVLDDPNRSIFLFKAINYCIKSNCKNENIIKAYMNLFTKLYYKNDVKLEAKLNEIFHGIPNPYNYDNCITEKTGNCCCFCDNWCGRFNEIIEPDYPPYYPDEPDIDDEGNPIVPTADYIVPPIHVQPPYHPYVKKNKGSNVNK